MALQDLTPQLRTRLNRMERAVGWFVFLAMALLIFGFGYYIYKTAETKGWFTRKINYHTSISSAAGFKVGDKVLLLGFPVGEITQVQRNQPGAYYNVTISFWVEAASAGYIWSDSTAKVNSDFLGNRFLEITKGVRGVPTILEDANKKDVGILQRKFLNQRIKELSEKYTDVTNKYTDVTNLFKALNEEAKNNSSEYYTNLTDKSVYWLKPDESPTVTDRAQALVSEVEAALPNFLALTNQINAVLSNSAALTSNLNEVVASTRPAASNLAIISEHLSGPKGSLGEWLIPTNINEQLAATLLNANVTLTNTDTNLVILAESIERSLDNLASITSNLNTQVQVNSNILLQISDTVVHTDQFVQGLKRHWLLRSAFKKPITNATPATVHPGAGPLR
jgi:ABC-type transporter Mla subunit MlaD